MKKMDEIKFGHTYINKITGLKYTPMYRSSAIGCSTPHLVTLQEQKTDKLMTVTLYDFDNIFEDPNEKEINVLISEKRSRIIKIKATNKELAYREVEQLINDGKIFLTNEDSEGINILV